MIAVIIAGGAGSRLWPLSKPDYPKHLLNIGDSRSSLLQQTFKRVGMMADAVYIVSEAGHIEHVRNQLPDLPDSQFIVEPARRGTAHAILSALAHVTDRHDADEPLAFVHADHYIRDNQGFMQSFKVAADATSRHRRMVLVGVEPDYPSTGFGYIEKGTVLEDDSFIYEVASFKEKPDYDTAQRYFSSGKYLWNCGYFVGSANTFIDTMQRCAPQLYENYVSLIQAEDFESAYLALDNLAIDYGLIELSDNLLVVPATFDWMDVGSFGDLHKAVGGDETGNALVGNAVLEDVSNTYVHNMEAKPVAVIGLDNVVVINTPDGLVVCRKDLSQKVGEISKRLNAS